MTLGALARPRVLQSLEDETGFAERLKRALSVRNDFAHRFGMRHAGALLDEEMRQEAMAECVQACDLFRPLITEVMECTEATGVDTGDVTVRDALAWAQDVTEAALGSGLPEEVSKELAHLFAEAARQDEEV